MTMNVFSQRFQYAAIIPYRNYSKISDHKSSFSNTFKDDINELDSKSFCNKLTLSYEEGLQTTNKKGRLINFNRPRKIKQKTKFFHNTEDVGESIQVDYAYSKNGNNDVYNYCDNVFFTTNDRHIKKHYGDPFSEIVIFTTERKIIEYDNKVTIRIFHQKKIRDINWIYFVKEYDILSLTIDLSTGNFTTLEIRNSKKLKIKKFRKNSFKTLKNFLTDYYGFLNYKISVINEEKIYSEFEKEFDNNAFNLALSSALGIPYFDYNERKDMFFKQIVQKFAILKKIKMPNSSHISLLIEMYPTEKYLKKNDRKLVSSILDSHGIKSKITNKLLHLYPQISVTALSKLCYFFGEDYPKYIGSISQKVFEKSPKEKTNYGLTASLNYLKEFKDRIKVPLGDDEKRSIIKILNNGTNNESSIFSNSFLNLLYDHIDMLNKLKVYDPHLKMKARDYDEFHKEHLDFSKMLTSIRKRHVIEYTYPINTVEKIEEKITTIESIDDFKIKREFYPVILKREEEYIEEGEFMHHCVAGYADKDNSIIISIRNESGNLRVTCEYDIATGKLIQSRYFCNGLPSTEFEEPLEIVSERVNFLSKKNVLKWEDKKRVILKINGVPISEVGILLPEVGVQGMPFFGNI